MIVGAASDFENQPRSGVFYRDRYGSDTHGIFGVVWRRKWEMDFLPLSTSLALERHDACETRDHIQSACGEVVSHGRSLSMNYE